MPPPGASAPAFAATVDPASSPQHATHPRQDASGTRDGTRAGDVLLPASILDFRARLANQCKKVVAQQQRGPRPILIFVLATKDSPPTAVVAATICRVRF